MSIAEVHSWLRSPDLQKFPYDAVVRDYHEGGKHFVAAELLGLLAEVRKLLPQLRGPRPHLQRLAAFLGVALDKYDEAYDYPSYLALPLLDLPDVDDPQVPFVRFRCDRLSVQLVADAMAFELAALDGSTTLLPRLRPGSEPVAKRCRHGVRAIQPALKRMSLDGGLTATDPIDLARQVCAVVCADMSISECQVLELSLLPVYTAHDEYMFLRVLQTFETTFALVAVQLRTAVAAIRCHAPDRAVHLIGASRAALQESAPLFSMLATMQVESFCVFRQFTEGASAIQSRNYKLVESLCRQPDDDRLDSPAFRSVPDVRDRVLDGQEDLDGAHLKLRASGHATALELRSLVQEMMAFADDLTRWRTTHYGVAKRMLGTATGTGYTEGVPYLNRGRAMPVFRPNARPARRSTPRAPCGERPRSG